MAAELSCCFRSADFLHGSSFSFSVEETDAWNLLTREAKKVHGAFSARSVSAPSFLKCAYSNIIEATGFCAIRLQQHESFGKKGISCTQPLRSLSKTLLQGALSSHVSDVSLPYESNISVSDQIEKEEASESQQESATEFSVVSSIVSALELAETANLVLSSVSTLCPSDLFAILHSLKQPKKIIGLFHWMKENCNTLDVHSMVFCALGKRREWIMLDSLLREEVKHLESRAATKVLNKLFQVCVTEDAPEWASQWCRFMVQETILPDMRSFWLLLPLFTKYKMCEDAEIIYQHLKSAGVEGSMVSLAILKMYLQAGQFVKAKQVYRKMRDANQDIQGNFFTMCLNAFVRDGKVQEAEDIIKFMIEFGVELGTHAYTAMITVNGKAGNFSRAREWFCQIEEDGLEPDAAAFRSIIGACGRAGKLQEALLYYDRMVACHFSPSLVNYNTLIHLHRKVDHKGRILALISDMRKAGCFPDSSTLNSVLKVYERYGRLEELPEAVKLLEEAGWTPTARCYGLLIRTYIRCSLVEQAMEVFSKLCTLSSLEEMMCHNLIVMCKHAGRYDEAIYVYHEMHKLGGIWPSLRTFCTMIDVYGLNGDYDKGGALFEELSSSEQELDAATYNVVLNMYMKAGLLQEAGEILKRVLQQEQLQPDLYLFLIMLKVCAKCGMQEDAVQIYWRIVSSKVNCTESLYTSIIHCCGRLLPLEEVSKVFDAMVSKNMHLNNVTCNILIDIFGKGGLLDKVHYVLRWAQKQGVQDCITFSTVIDAYGKNRQYSQMESVLTEMLNEGFRGCVGAYNSMLNAYGNSGQIGKMENTLERMRTVGCIPNLSTFNTLIKVYAQEGLFGDLLRVLKQVDEANMKLDAYSYNTLIHAYGSVQMLDQSLKWLERMQDAGFVPERITYNCLISALRNGGYDQDADRLLSWTKAGV